MRVSWGELGLFLAIENIEQRSQTERNVSKFPEPVFVNLVRSPGIDSQPGGIDSSEWIPGLPERLQQRALTTAVVRRLSDPAEPHSLHMWDPDPGSKGILIQKAKNSFGSGEDPDRSQHMIGMAKAFHGAGREAQEENLILHWMEQ
jgi:hypothetical protein